LRLHRQGHPIQACCEAGNGDAAINKVKERAPALVILDLSMPMLNGVETASALRRMVPGMKIIGLAMFAGEFRRTLIAAAGFDMILCMRASRSWQRRSTRCCPLINELAPALQREELDSRRYDLPGTALPGQRVSICRMIRSALQIAS
jgi:DNA-binding NarL/FixJ family response regulator